MDKRALRKQIMEKILMLDPLYTQSADRKITEHLLSFEPYRSARTVFCFAGTEHEINTFPFMQQVLSDGKTLCVPLCIGKMTMEARQILSLVQLKPGRYHIPEPPAQSPLIHPDKIDLAVIPCITCSHAGERLGHGGGYYDAYFSRHPDIPAVMICREKVMVEHIPVESHDIAFRTVISENGIFR